MQKHALTRILTPIFLEHYKIYENDSDAARRIMPLIKYDGGVETLRRTINKVRIDLGLKYDNKYERVIKNKDVTVKDDKKKGEFNWREWSGHLQKRQDLHEKASYSQDSTEQQLTTKLPYIIFQPLSDTHFGALGTDYWLLENYTDMIVKDSRIYTCLLGDMADNFVNFKNLLAVHQQILSPEEQEEFLESWINEIKHKVLFSSWGNHEEFEERATGRNIIKRILKKNVVYMNGMAEVIIKINKIEYRIAVTHRTRFWTEYNRTHGVKRMLREQFPKATIGIAGDKHVPGFEEYIEAGEWKLAVQLGTFKINDGYAKRYFSYKTISDMPVIVFNTNFHEVIPFKNLDMAIRFVEGK